MITIETPTLRDISSFGNLAYVSSKERNRIMGLQTPERNRLLDLLAKEVDSLNIKKRGLR